MENTEWPDAERLKELREEGLFPYSFFAVRCMITTCILSVSYFLTSKFTKIAGLIKKMLSEPVSNFSASKLAAVELAHETTLVFLIYAVSFILVFSISVLIQSKFYFSLVNLSFNLSQVLKVRNLSLSFFIFTVLKGIGGIILGLFVSTLAYYWVSRQYLGVLFSDTFFGTGELHVGIFSPVVKSILTLGIFVLIICSAISYLLARYVFLNKHKKKAV